MPQPRAIQPFHFQAILSWWDGTFKWIISKKIKNELHNLAGSEIYPDP